MNLAKLSIRRPVATIMLMMVVVVVGFASLLGLPRDLFPEIELPVAVVMTNYNNASPEEVEKMVTEPLENSLSLTQDLQKMRSLSSQGASIIVMKFQTGTDMDFATLDIREKISLIKGYLADEVSEPRVMKIDLQALPVMSVYVSGDMELDKLNTFVEDNVIEKIKKSKGVANVDVLGGVEKEVSVDIQKEKLDGYGLTSEVISQILKSENLNLPSGTIMKGDEKAIVRVTGAFNSLDDIKNIPLKLSDRSVVKLSDLADVKYKNKEQKSISRINSKNAIALVVKKQSDANTVKTAKYIEKNVEKLREKYPNLNFNIRLNQADFINSSLKSVVDAAFIGGLMAILAVFIFLRNFRTTLVIGMSIPVSILAAMALMKTQGMTLNLYTLAALTITVGMVVDNSIVVLENIFRKRQEIDDSNLAAEEGSNEIFLAVVASTMTTLVVFLPIAFSGGITGLLFKDFCMTIVTTLLASLLISITVVPMLCSLMLKKGVSRDYVRFGKKRYKYKFINKFDNFMDGLKISYENFMKKALKHRKKVIGVCILIFVLSIILIGIVGTEFSPQVDEGAFEISVEMPQGTTLDEKDKMMKKLEKYVEDMPGVKDFAITIGESSMSFQETFILEATIEENMRKKYPTSYFVNQARRDLIGITGANINISESTSSGGGFGGDADMSLNIKGKDITKLGLIAEELCDKIKKIENVESVVNNGSKGSTEIKVKLNRNIATSYGISTFKMAKNLSGFLSGSSASSLKIEGEEIKISVNIKDEKDKTLSDVKNIMFKTLTGEKVRLGDIADFENAESPISIRRMDKQRYVQIEIDVHGKTLGKVSKEVIKMMEDYDFPSGYNYDTGGKQEDMSEAFGNLLLALLVAIALVYLILAAQFESLLLPLMVMVAIPFAMPGAFLLMFITGTALSVVSFLGLIMLAGIVVNSAILLVEFIYRNEKTMGKEKALIEAGKMRIRPIFMSAGTTCVGMIPLAMGMGEGNESLAPLGIAIIGGLVASTAVTIILIPVIYSIFDDQRKKSADKRNKKSIEISELEKKWRDEDLEAEKL